MSKPFKPVSTAAKTDVLFSYAKKMHEQLEGFKVKKPRTLRCANIASSLLSESLTDLDSHLRRSYDLDFYTNDGHFSDRDIAVSGISVNARIVLRQQSPTENIYSRDKAINLPLLFMGVEAVELETLGQLGIFPMKGVMLKGVDINQAFLNRETGFEGPEPHLYVRFDELQITSSAQHAVMNFGSQPA